jgi:DNA-binding LytR/AlgR family response regulator
MKTAIVDDSKYEADILSELLEQYSVEKKFDLAAEYFSSGEDFLRSLNKNSYDAVFMDIYMDGLDGIETARRLWEADSKCLVIFLTTSREHIWQATSMHCFDYIPKDQLSANKVFSVIDDIRRKNSLPDAFISFTSGTREVMIKTADIQFILSNGNYTEFTLVDGRSSGYRVSFSNIADMLADQRSFVQCNRGVMINMDHVASELSDSFEMKNGQRLPIRKRNRTGILKLYHDYLFDKLDEM